MIRICRPLSTSYLLAAASQLQRFQQLQRGGRAVAAAFAVSAVTDQRNDIMLNVGKFPLRFAKANCNVLGLIS